MDLKKNIIDDVLMSLQETLTYDQLQIVKNSLYVNLNQYDLQEKSTDLVVPDNTSQMLLKKFIATKKMEGKSESTLKRYFDICTNMIECINKPIKDITVYDLRFYLASYKQNRNVSNVTLDGIRRCLKSFFSWLFAENLINSNPTSSLSQIKYEKVIKQSFTEIDMEKLKRSCDNLRDRALIEFLYSSGCRVSEVASLNRSDINYDAKEVIVFGKGSKERIVYLTDVALLYIKEYLDSRKDDNPCLFAQLISPYGRLSKNGIEATLKKIGNKANVQNVHPHRYRRTLATNLINRGANIQDVATILGHEDLKTTQIYCNINQHGIKMTHDKYIV